MCKEHCWSYLGIKPIHLQLFAFSERDERRMGQDDGWLARKIFMFNCSEQILEASESTINFRLVSITLLIMTA